MIVRLHYISGAILLFFLVISEGNENGVFPKESIPFRWNDSL